MEQIKYKEGFKYQLAEDYTIKTDIIGYIANLQFLKLTLIGVLTIKSGYAWDGPSGPTIDTKDSMRGSLVHDAFYQLMRYGIVSQDERKLIDQLLENICLIDGMNAIRAEMWRQGVSLLAGNAADPSSKKEIILAPY